jgi:hypothetical protein
MDLQFLPSETAKVHFRRRQQSFPSRWGDKGFLPLGQQRTSPAGASKDLSRWGVKSGISKNSVKKTVRGNAAELLSEERSDEFNESSVYEKVFSCFIEAGEPFCFFLGGSKKKSPVVVTTEKR